VTAYDDGLSSNLNFFGLNPMATIRGLTQKGKGTNVGVSSPGLHIKDRSKTTKSLELNMYFFLV
jgi:hypothetical protein